jgi:hypothetical protein
VTGLPLILPGQGKARGKAWLTAGVVPAGKVLP